MKHPTTSALLALAAALVYVVFALVSALYFPAAYSPLTNWLSDLGNPTQNPSGALYYNLGGALTSLVLLAFFASMATWKATDRKTKTLLRLSQIFGLAFACAFIVTVIYPLGVDDQIHSGFSVVLFVCAGFFEIFSATAMRRNAGDKKLFLFGITVALVNFVFGVSFNFANVFIGEWVMIGLLIAYTLTLALTRKEQQPNLPLPTNPLQVPS